MTKFFYDSYAILEFINGNPNYSKYFIKHEGVTTLYNVMEVFYITLREEGEEKAKKILNFMKSITIYPSFDDVENSMKFRLIHKKKKLSYADCLGYTMANKNNIKFLTGDKEFKEITNVEFVK